MAEVRCHFQGCGEAFASLAAFEHHYELLHRDACSACRRAFPSRRLLDLHLLEQHGAALFQLQFQCLVEGCPEAFRSPEDRKEHLVAAHCYPPDFRFDKTPKRGRYLTPQRGRDGSPMVSSHSHGEGSPGPLLPFKGQPPRRLPLIPPLSSGSRAKARRPRSREDGAAPMEVADPKEEAEEAMEEGPKGSRQARRQVTPRYLPILVGGFVFWGSHCAREGGNVFMREDNNNNFIFIPRPISLKGLGAAYMGPSPVINNIKTKQLNWSNNNRSKSHTKSNDKILDWIQRNWAKSASCRYHQGGRGGYPSLFIYLLPLYAALLTPKGTQSGLQIKFTYNIILV
uniref:C2H2-type domain-containing protein n=1 Tax=Anolis carolinensis TaxID=28377 RepID=A0A803TWY3_ANOCA